jgi:hypothetical protein
MPVIDKNGRSLDDAKTSILTDHNKTSISYRFKDLLQYCKEEGLAPTDLKENDLVAFEVKKGRSNNRRPNNRRPSSKYPLRVGIKVRKQNTVDILEPKKVK